MIHKSIFFCDTDPLFGRLLAVALACLCIRHLLIKASWVLDKFVNLTWGDSFQELFLLSTYYVENWVFGGHLDISKQRMNMLSPGIRQYYFSLLGCDPNNLWQLPILMML